VTAPPAGTPSYPEPVAPISPPTVPSPPPVDYVAQLQRILAPLASLSSTTSSLEAHDTYSNVDTALNLATWPGSAQWYIHQLDNGLQQLSTDYFQLNEYQLNPYGTPPTVNISEDTSTLNSDIQSAENALRWATP
jgi:hypothetical protein